ncbi:lysylphosphatidylglycerol synthase domain-containing protein [Kocuria sp. cx-455]|uniref:lysylphosphatidylglycerol synthase domain-containing protein n=1 Tax=Kocuria sp. cx-455 TaxID=2771377 RepID=UPI003D7399F6
MSARWLQRTVLAAVTLLLLGLTAHAVGLQALLAGWRVLSPLTVLAALAAGLIVALTQAVRWKALAAEQQIHLSFRRAWGDCYASAFGNMVLPGGLGGDVARVAVYRHRGRRRWWSPVLAVGAERLSATACLFIVTALVVGASAQQGEAQWPAAVVAAVAAALFLAAAIVCLRGVPARRQLIVWSASALSVLTLIGLFLLAMAQLGGPVHAPVATVGLASMSVPVGVGGWGVREFSVGALAPAMGVPAGQAVTAATGYGVLAVVSTLPGAAVLARGAWRRAARPGYRVSGP